MKKGDLVQFSDNGLWRSSVSGKIGIVVDVRPNPFGVSMDDMEVDLMFDDRIYLSFLLSHATYGVEVISGAW
jgi:hypothetical protein